MLRRSWQLARTVPQASSLSSDQGGDDDDDPPAPRTRSTSKFYRVKGGNASETFCVEITHLLHRLHDHVPWTNAVDIEYSFPHHGKPTDGIVIRVHVFQ